MSKSTSAGAAESARTILCLVRHGDAGDALALPELDALRGLTSKGRRQAKRAGKALRSLELEPRDVWVSRLRRAAETAEVATAALPHAPRWIATAALAPEALPERIAKALHETPPAPIVAPKGAADTAKGGRKGPAGKARGSASAPSKEAAPVARWLVGHEPHLSRLLSYLTGAPAEALRLPKGSIALVECDGRGPQAGACHLQALFTPQSLKALRS